MEPIEIVIIVAAVVFVCSVVGWSIYKKVKHKGSCCDCCSQCSHCCECVKENKNKSIEAEEGLIHISKILKVMGQILSYYINRIELSCDKDYVLGIEKGMMMSLRDDINKLSKRYKV